VPKYIGAIISNKLATMHELDSVLSTEDMFDLLEIIAIDSYNQRIVNKE
jgi:hypothetical protein